MSKTFSLLLLFNNFCLLTIYTSYEGTPPQSDIPEELVEILKVNIAVNSSYSSKLLHVSEVMLYYVLYYVLSLFVGVW